MYHRAWENSFNDKGRIKMAQENNVRRERNIDPRVIALAVVAGVLVLIVGFVVGMGIYVNNCDTIYPNVTVSGIKVGGMTYDQAHMTLTAADISIPEGIEATAVLTDEVSVKVTSEDAGLASSVTEFVDEAYSYGRDGNFLTNMVMYMRCMRGSHDVYNERIFNEEGVRNLISDCADMVNHGATEGSYTLTDSEIILVKGSAGYTVDEEGVYKFIRSTLLSGNSATTDEFSEAKNAQAQVGEDGQDYVPDFDKIFEEIHTEPVNSVYDPATKTATEDVVGLSFDLNEAHRLYDLAVPGDTVKIPLVKTEPEITQVMLSGMLFRDKLAEKMTDMYTSTSNRINNIDLAAKAVNGTVLNPGDEFSFNKVVGERTAAKGYKPAGAYVGGKSVDEIGGGICQASSTLYYCALMSNLEITSRSNHMFSVSYLPLGLDATVSWNSIDFKFKNSSDYPIEIKAWVENKELYVEFWGSKVDENTVELESKTIETIGYETIEKLDNTLRPGERKVDTSGHSGYVSEAYKVVRDGDGKVISRTLLSKDTYRAQDRVILVGPEPETRPPAPQDPCNGNHTWDEGEETTPATCTVDGSRTYTCTVCGETKTETIPATGHEYDDSGICIHCGEPRPGGEVTPPPDEGGDGGGEGDGGDEGGDGGGDTGGGDEGGDSGDEGDPPEPIDPGPGDGTVG